MWFSALEPATWQSLGHRKARRDKLALTRVGVGVGVGVDGVATSAAGRISIVVARVRPEGVGRLEAFSDGVLAIVLTLLVLDLLPRESEVADGAARRLAGVYSRTSPHS